MKWLILLGMLIGCTSIATAAETSNFIIKIKFQGFNCQYCTYRLQRAFHKIPELSEFNINDDDNMIRLITDSKNPQLLSKIKQIISNAGYAIVNSSIQEAPKEAY